MRKSYQLVYFVKKNEEDWWLILYLCNIQKAQIKKNSKQYDKRIVKSWKIKNMFLLSYISEIIGMMEISILFKEKKKHKQIFRKNVKFCIISSSIYSSVQLSVNFRVRCAQKYSLFFWKLICLCFCFFIQPQINWTE